MKNKENTISYSGYATDAKELIRNRIELAKKEGRDLLIVSDTDSGKTTLAMQLSNDFVKEQIETGIVVPLQSIVASKEGSDKLMDFGSGGYFTMSNEMTGNAYFTVYNTFSNSNKTKSTEYLFVDEPQVLIQQANIRGVVNAKILESNATKIYLTGTPFMLPEALGCDVVYLEREEPTSKSRVVKCYTSNDNDESIIFKILEHKKGICTKVIRINDKKVITKMAGQLKSMGKTVVTYYSADSEEAYLLENKDYLMDNTFEDLRKGVFNDVDFVLCTSALDSGVDLVCDRELFLYCIGRYDRQRDTRLMPHPVDVKQFSARPRKQQIVNVYCIGHFEGSTSITSTHFEGQEDYFSSVRGNSIDTLQYLQILSETYRNSEYNDSISWSEQLENLGIAVEHKGFLDAMDGIKISLRLDLQVIIHLKKSSQFGDIVQKRFSSRIVSPDGEYAYHKYELGIDLEELSDVSEDSIYKPTSLVQIEELATYVRKASEFGVDLKPFYTDKFRTKKLKEIIHCLSSIGRDTDLGLAISKIIKEGSISKSSVRLLEGDGDMLETFLKTYFIVNRNAFNQDEIKEIRVKGLKKSSAVPPMKLIEFLEDVNSDWLSSLVKDLQKAQIKPTLKEQNENKQILELNNAFEGMQLELI